MLLIQIDKFMNVFKLAWRLRILENTWVCGRLGIYNCTSNRHRAMCAQKLSIALVWHNEQSTVEDDSVYTTLMVV